MLVLTLIIIKSWLISTIELKGHYVLKVVPIKMSWTQQHSCMIVPQAPPSSILGWKGWSWCIQFVQPYGQLLFDAADVITTCLRSTFLELQRVNYDDRQRWADMRLTWLMKAAILSWSSSMRTFSSLGTRAIKSSYDLYVRSQLKIILRHFKRLR